MYRQITITCMLCAIILKSLANPANYLRVSDQNAHYQYKNQFLNHYYDDSKKENKVFHAQHIVSHSNKVHVQSEFDKPEEKSKHESANETKNAKPNILNIADFHEVVKNATRENEVSGLTPKEKQINKILVIVKTLRDPKTNPIANLETNNDDINKILETSTKGYEVWEIEEDAIPDFTQDKTGKGL